MGLAGGPGSQPARSFAPGQTAAAAAKNQSFFAANDRYAERIARLETYRNIRAAIEPQLIGMRRLLDVGNGGVFEYDTRLVDRITAVDLFLDEAMVDRLPFNVTPRRGDALALDLPDEGFDGVLLSNLLHHLVGSRADDVVKNARRALEECHRVMRPGGRLVVVESCVPRWFYAVERVLYGGLAAVARTRLMKHPPTVQLPAETLTTLARERFADVGVQRIPVGLVLLQLGHRWPSALTPARPYLLTAKRP